jgi:hypothetical protein
MFPPVTGVPGGASYSLYLCIPRELRRWNGVQAPTDPHPWPGKCSLTGILYRVYRDILHYRLTGIKDVSRLDTGKETG